MINSFFWVQNLNIKYRQIHCIFIQVKTNSKHTYQLLLCLTKLKNIIFACIKTRKWIRHNKFK